MTTPETETNPDQPNEGQDAGETSGRKRLGSLIAGVGGPVLVLIVALFLALPMINTGGAVETWITKTALSALEEQIGREITVDRVEYEGGLAAVILGLNVKDPSGEDMFTAERVRLAFAGIPKPNGPLKLRSIEIASPVLILGSSGGNGSETSAPAQQPTDDIGHPAGDKRQFALSQWLVLRAAKVVNGQVRTRDETGEQMVLDAITFDLSFVPKEASGDGMSNTDGKDQAQPPYEFDIQFGREPGMAVACSGTFDADALILDVDEGTISVDASQKTLASLPAVLREFAKEHEASGRLDLRVQGEIPLRDWSSGEFAAALDAKGVDMTFGEFRLPIPEAGINVVLAENTLRTDGCLIETAGGPLSLHMNWEPASEGSSLAARWNVESLDLGAFLKASSQEAGSGTGEDPKPDGTARQIEQTAEEISHAVRSLADIVLPGEGKKDKDVDQPPIAGLLTTSGSVSFDATDWSQTMSGSGSAFIREGWLVKLPVVTQINQAAGAVGVGGSANHELDMTFEPQAGRVMVDIQRLRTTAVGGRGEGYIGYDSELNLDMRVGPLERLRILTGGVGDAIAALTDEVFPTYKVRGTLAKPTVGLTEPSAESPPAEPDKEPQDDPDEAPDGDG